LMGGEIGVRSEVGAGSTFWFELPLSAASATSARDVTEAVTRVRTVNIANAAQRTLLYVEDNPANLNLVEQLIARRSDLKLLLATNGRSGVKMAQEQLPDLILMDINLPDISGLEALKLLQAMPEKAHIPIMALSANVVPRDVEKGLKAGFLRYLTKPIKIDEFMDALDAVLAKSDKNVAR
jgi:CheY-like chemotaxis protein